jgi:glutamate transport system substrate-binding protein
MRTGVIAVPIVAILLGVLGCGQVESEPDPKMALSGPVNVGVTLDTPGFSEYTTGGVWNGFDISLIRWLAEEIGFTPQFVPMTADERMIKLVEATDHPDRAGVTMVVANFSMTDDRRSYIDMAGPYFIDAQGFLTLADSKTETIDDYANQPVCVTVGSTNEGRIPGTKSIAVSEATLTQCVELLRQGTVKAISSDIILLEGLKMRHEGLRLTGIRIGAERYGIGIPNRRPKLCRFLRDGLKKFLDNAWEQKLRDNMPYASTADRKPNSDALDLCQDPNEANEAQRPGPAAPVWTSTVARRASRRRPRFRPGFRPKFDRCTCGPALDRRWLDP